MRLISRVRYIIMRNNRTEVFCGLAREYKFMKVSELKDTPMKTYVSSKKAQSAFERSWYNWKEEEIEIVAVTETLEFLDDKRALNTIYGYSDDLIEIEGHDDGEIGCWNEEVEIIFQDKTHISIVYGDEGIWKITYLNKGSARQELKVCEEETDEGYSDILKIDSVIKTVKVGGKISKID